jgi:uncharacterized LabA/DUF88 family protein
VLKGTPEMAPETTNEPKASPAEAPRRPFIIPGKQLGQRVGIFVDVQNLFYSAKHLRQSKVNYRKLIEDLTAGRKLVRAIAYLVTKPEVDQTGFVDALTKLGYEIRVKYLKIRPDGTAKGDWAMELSLDVMSIAPRLDTVTLVTGDGDYVPLVERLKILGCRTEVVGFPQNTATELMNAAHAFVAIDDSMLFKEKKFETEAASRTAGNAAGFAPTARLADSVASRFAASASSTVTGAWADGADGQADAPQIDDEAAERAAAQLWDREHNK